MNAYTEKFDVIAKTAITLGDGSHVRAGQRLEGLRIKGIAGRSVSFRGPNGLPWLGPTRFFDVVERGDYGWTWNACGRERIRVSIPA